MWGQEKKEVTSSSEQEGEEVIMIAANPTIAEGTGRSEEHTSELQSPC